jgi:hypothetical protein
MNVTGVVDPGAFLNEASYISRPGINPDLQSYGVAA